jgi:GTPase SAR1 family protein
LKELRQHADPNVCVIIVGNKTDLRPQRTVLHEEGRAFAGKSCLSDFIC